MSDQDIAANIEHMSGLMRFNLTREHLVSQKRDHKLN